MSPTHPQGQFMFKYFMKASLPIRFTLISSFSKFPAGPYNLTLSIDSCRLLYLPNQTVNYCFLSSRVNISRERVIVTCATLNGSCGGGIEME